MSQGLAVRKRAARKGAGLKARAPGPVFPRACRSDEVPAASAASAYALLALASFFWAGNYIVGRAVRFDIEPVSLAFWRAALAFLMLLPVGLGELRRNGPEFVAAWPHIAALGFTGVAAYHIAIYFALAGTTALNATLLLSTIPIAIAAAAWLMLRQTVSPLQAAGIVISFGGVLVVIAHGDPAALLSVRFNAGDLWMLAGVPLWAVYSVLLMRLPAGLPPLGLLTASMGAGTLGLLPVYLWRVAAGASLPLSWPAVLGLVYVSLFASVLGYLFWNRGVAMVGPNRAGTFIHLTPVFGAIMAVALLGEHIAAYHVAGAALVCLGIVLVTRRPSLTARAGRV